MLVQETERAEEKNDKRKKNQKQNFKRRNEWNNPRTRQPPCRLGNASAMSPCRLFWRILIPNRQVPKGVGTEMRALVASWGLLVHDEGAWSAVELKPRVSRVGGGGAAVLACLGVLLACTNRAHVNNTI